MNAQSCCGTHSSDCSKKDSGQVSRFTYESSFLKRCLNFFRWMFTGSVIVLLPKCPFCLAAYIAMATGIGLSFSVASFIRILLIILCIVSLSSFVARRVYIYYNREQLYMSPGDHRYRINLLALKLSLILALYFLMMRA